MVAGMCSPRAELRWGKHTGDFASSGEQVIGEGGFAIEDESLMVLKLQGAYINPADDEGVG